MIGGKILFNQDILFTFTKEIRVKIEIARHGISVFCCKELPQLSRESGNVTKEILTIRQMYEDGKNIYLADEIDAFGALLDEKFRLESRSVIIENGNPMILSHARVTEKGERIVFIANMSNEDFNGKISFYGDYSAIYLADCHTGDISPIDNNIARGTTASVILEIESGEGKFILLK